jgi:hypothetical protein
LLDYPGGHTSDCIETNEGVNSLVGG